MEKSKYYTPDITEFCVGFECEMKNSSDHKYFEWEKCTFKDDFSCKLNDDYCFEYLFADLKECNIRVKCLDEEDILDLGWTKTEDKCPYTGRNYFKINKEDGFNTGVVYKIVLYQNGSLHYMWESYSSYATDKGQMIINIKNKTEFKKLMEQLRINYGI